MSFPLFDPNHLSSKLAHSQQVFSPTPTSTQARTHPHTQKRKEIKPFSKKYISKTQNTNCTRCYYTQPTRRLVFASFTKQKTHLHPLLHSPTLYQSWLIPISTDPISYYKTILIGVTKLGYQLLKG